MVVSDARSLDVGTEANEVDTFGELLEYSHVVFVAFGQVMEGCGSGRPRVGRFRAGCLRFSTVGMADNGGKR